MGPLIVVVKCISKELIEQMPKSTLCLLSSELCTILKGLCAIQLEDVLTNGGDVLAVDLLVAEIVVVVVYHHLPPHHLSSPASPGPQTPAKSSASAAHATSGLRLLASPGRHRDGDTHTVCGEQVPGLGPHRDVLGVEVADAGQVHEGVVT